MKKILLSLAAIMIAATSYANGPKFGPNLPVKDDVKAQSLGYEVRSVNDIKLVAIGDNKNANGAVQKPLQSFESNRFKAYTTATVSTNSDVNKAYAGFSVMGKGGPVVPGLSVDFGVTVRGAELSKSLRVDNSYFPTVALDIDPETLVRHITSTPSRVEGTIRKVLNQIFNK